MEASRPFSPKALAGSSILRKAYCDIRFINVAIMRNPESGSGLNLDA